MQLPSADKQSSSSIILVRTMEEKDHGPITAYNVEPPVYWLIQQHIFVPEFLAIYPFPYLAMVGFECLFSDQMHFISIRLSLFPRHQVYLTCLIPG